MHTRILSLDLRAKKFGYAVFEGQFILLDYGASRSTNGETLISRVEKLMQKFHPEFIVLRRVSAKSRRDNPVVRKTLRAIRSTAKHRAVPLVSIADELISMTFQSHGKPTKHQIASLLAACFPELAWDMPPIRKPWMPEDIRITLFNAAATALAYFVSQGNGEAVHQMLFRGGSFRRPFHSGD